MDNLIDRQALDVVAFTDRDGTFSDGVQWLLEYIDALPSAERQGKWLDGYGFAGNYFDCFVCDQCKKENMAKTNYCPNCGARMIKIGR